MIGTRRTWGNVRVWKRLRPITRPELTTAFETAGDTAIQAILLPPKYFRRVIEETMPQLPKEIGGGAKQCRDKRLPLGGFEQSISHRKLLHDW